MDFEFRQNLPCRLHIFRHDHKAQVLPDLLHVLHGMQEISPIQIQFRVVGIFPSPDVDDAEILLRIFVRIRIFMHLQPVPHLFPVLAEISLRLHISIQNRILSGVEKALIRTRDIAAVRHVMDRIPHIQAVVPLNEFPVTSPVRFRNLYAEIQIHEIHSLLRMKDISDLSGVDAAKRTPVVLRNTSGGDITQELIPQPLPLDKFGSNQLFVRFCHDRPSRCLKSSS